MDFGSFIAEYGQVLVFIGAALLFLAVIKFLFSLARGFALFVKRYTP